MVAPVEPAYVDFAESLHRTGNRADGDKRRDGSYARGGSICFARI